MVMGLIAGHHKHTNAAMRAFQTVVDINDNRLEAHAQLARCLVLRGAHAQAEVHADKIANSNTDQPKLLDLVATVYSHIGKQEKSLSIYDRCLDRDPNNATYLSNAASCLIFLGKNKRAEKLLSQAINQQPSNARLHWQYAKLVTATDDKHLTTMKSLANDKVMQKDTQAKTMLDFAIGKSYEDLKQWPQAWQYYQQGNSSQHHRLSYRSVNDTHLFAALTKTFTQERINQAKKSSDSTEQPIFIVGLPRSGTTLVERIVSSHSHVQSLGELPQFPIETKKLSGDTEKELIHPSMATQLLDIDMSRLAEKYLSEISYLRNSQSRFTDKLPHNYLYVGLIAAAFPRAKFICLQRNPMDNCFALYKQLFANAYPFSYDQQELASYYLGFQTLVEHWQSVLPAQFQLVGYEDLVKDQETSTRSLLEFLELDFEASCLKFEINTSAAATASAAQVRQKIHTNSVERWKNFEVFLEPLKQALNI